MLQSSLEDPSKAAAIREYVEHWAIAQRWIDEHPKEWLEGYYVKDQGLSEEDGQWLIDNVGHPEIPTDWTQHIADHQETIDLLVKEQDKPELDAETLWDRRFEKLGGDGVQTGKLVMTTHRHRAADRGATCAAPSAVAVDQRPLARRLGPGRRLPFAGVPRAGAAAGALVRRVGVGLHRPADAVGAVDRLTTRRWR